MSFYICFDVYCELCTVQGGEGMEVDDKEDYSEVMNDPAFLQSVLQNLPGVDPQSKAVKKAMGAIKVTFLDLFCLIEFLHNL